MTPDEIALVPTPIAMPVIEEGKKLALIPGEDTNSFVLVPLDAEPDAPSE